MRKSRLTSLQEAENAVVAYAQEQNRHAALAVEVAQNQRSLGMADAMYSKGRVNFLDVLDARRSLYQSDDELAVSDQAIAVDLVALYKALGGGWETLTKQASSPMTADAAPAALHLDGVSKSFRRETGESVLALDNISFSIRKGGLAALAGPDGAGKTTLLRLLAGLMKADRGTVAVLGFDAAKDPQAIQSRISYMPQQFGLYDDLTVRENLDLYADLHGITAEVRRTQYASLMEMTGLEPFQTRLSGQLSGGMKQKLGLACTLVHSPELLLLDEPTVGVDPLSRRELWEIIHKLVKQGMTVLIAPVILTKRRRANGSGPEWGKSWRKVLRKMSPVSRMAVPSSPNRRMARKRGISRPNCWTSPMSSTRYRRADRSGWSLRLHPKGPRSERSAGVPVKPTPERFEDGFMVLLRQAGGATRPHTEARRPREPAIAGARGDIVVEVHDLCRRFGKFLAVDHVSFSVKRGEIFGLLGPNGAGKTTTFRMLCGLLPASDGTLKIAGTDVRQHQCLRAAASGLRRAKIFALWTIDRR